MAEADAQDRHLSGGFEGTPPEEDPNRNQHQAQNEKAGQDQVEENAEIGIGGTAVAEELDNPEAN